MQLRKHYLEEDHTTMINELYRLSQSILYILNNVATASFTDNQKHMDQIDESLKILMFLNKKKLEHDKENHFININEQVRKDWF